MHTTSLRLDFDLERRFWHAARLGGVPYQTLLKSFVQERLYEEEKRLKVIEGRICMMWARKCPSYEEEKRLKVIEGGGYSRHHMTAVSSLDIFLPGE